jgi:hypothetical protein
MKTKIFLIGGADLEMNEIKKLVKNMPNTLTFDNGLSWYNADISSYENDEYHINNELHPIVEKGGYMRIINCHKNGGSDSIYLKVGGIYKVIWMKRNEETGKVICKLANPLELKVLDD